MEADRATNARGLSAEACLSTSVQEISAQLVQGFTGVASACVDEWVCNSMREKAVFSFIAPGVG